MPWPASARGGADHVARPRPTCHDVGHDRAPGPPRAPVHRDRPRRHRRARPGRGHRLLPRHVRHARRPRGDQRGAGGARGDGRRRRLRLAHPAPRPALRGVDDRQVPRPLRPGHAAARLPRHRRRGRVGRPARARRAPAVRRPAPRHVRQPDQLHPPQGRRRRPRRARRARGPAARRTDAGGSPRHRRPDAASGPGSPPCSPSAATSCTSPTSTSPRPRRSPGGSGAAPSRSHARRPGRRRLRRRRGTHRRAHGLAGRLGQQRRGASSPVRRGSRPRSSAACGRGQHDRRHERHRQRHRPDARRAPAATWSTSPRWPGWSPCRARGSTPGPSTRCSASASAPWPTCGWPASGASTSAASARTASGRRCCTTSSTTRGGAVVLRRAAVRRGRRHRRRPGARPAPAGHRGAPLAGRQVRVVDAFPRLGQHGLALGVRLGRRAQRRLRRDGRPAPRRANYVTHPTAGGY